MKSYNLTDPSEATANIADIKATLRATIDTMEGNIEILHEYASEFDMSYSCEVDNTLKRIKDCKNLLGRLGG